MDIKIALKFWGERNTQKVSNPKVEVNLGPIISRKVYEENI